MFLLIRLDAAIAATEGKVNLALVDIDNLSDLALDYDVQAVPTVLAVKDGKVRLMEYKSLSLIKFKCIHMYFYSSTKNY